MINNLLDLTWNNPVFMFVAIGAIWFIPGILVRRVAENRYKIAKAESQSKKIARLYPKKNQK